LADISFSTQQEIEQLILATAIESAEVSAFLSTVADVSSFALTPARIVFRLIKQLRIDQPYGPLSTRTLKFLAFEETKKEGGIISKANLPMVSAFLSKMADVEPDANPEASMGVWRQYFDKQRIRQELEQAQTSLDKGETVETLKEELIQGLSSYGKDEVVFHDLHNEFQQRWDGRKNRIKKGHSLVIPTGFPSLDAGLEGGLPTGRIMILAGYPGVGKSFILTNMLVHAYEQGFDVLHITTENTEEEALCRAESIRCGNHTGVLWIANMMSLWKGLSEKRKGKTATV